MTSLPYLVKLGKTGNQELLKVGKKMWDCLLSNQIAVTKAIQKLQGFKRLEIEPKIFSHIVKIKGIPQTGLFAS